MAFSIKFYNVRHFTTKYLIAQDVHIQTDIKPASSVITRYVNLTTEGVLTLKKGMPTDGPSGPTIDTPNVMTPSLVHDGVYMLLRLGAIPQKFRKPADLLFYKMLRANGVSRVRARVFYWGVRAFGSRYAKKRDKPKVLTAHQEDY